MTLADPSQIDAGKDRLTLLVCGSVDDGKSTMIGRLLHDSRLITDDIMAALVRDSGKSGHAGGDVDLALLLDGLEAEREQGITIDVAYCYFTTDRRSFIVADTPGHEQFTRNMATGASTAQLAVILIDVRKGILDQTRRHARICALFGVRHVVFAINKMDLVNYDATRFAKLADETAALTRELGIVSVHCIPMSARDGDNVIYRSGYMPWYHGPPLLELLETITIDVGERPARFRFQIQWVNRQTDFRGYAGTVASGRIRKGDLIVVPTSGRTSRIKDIIADEAVCESAEAGDAVTLTLTDDIDIARGDILCEIAERPQLSNRFSAHVLWTGDKPLAAGQPCLMRIGTRTTTAWLTVESRLDIPSGRQIPASEGSVNDILICNVLTAYPLAFEPYDVNKRMGAFILIDRATNRTIAAGMIRHSLQHGDHAQQDAGPDKERRAVLKHQRPLVLWFTGLSGAGKSTIARLVERRLHDIGHHTMLLDGDQLRVGLNRDLDFSREDRLENIRRVGEVAKLMVDAGLIVLCAFISPFRADRDMVRGLFMPDEFIEIFVDTSVEECASRDTKGLYAHVRSGELTNFTGFDSPYERPDNPEMHLETAGEAPEALAERVSTYVIDLERRLAEGL